MSGDDEEDRFNPDEIREKIDEQLSLIDEIGADLQRNFQDLINDTDPRDMDIPQDLPSSQVEVIEQIIDKYSEHLPSTSTMGSAGTLIGGLIGGPGGAALLGTAGIGIGMWKDMERDRMLLSLVVSDVPSNIDPIDYSDATIQNTRPIKYTIKMSSETDLNMGRIRNTLAKTYDFDKIENAFEDLPTTTLPSSEFPDVAYVRHKNTTVAVWIEEI